MKPRERPVREEGPVDQPAQTERLRIEPLQARHAPLLFDALADARIYSYIPDEMHASVDSLTRRYAFLEQGAPRGADDVWLNWALQRIDTSAYIGTLQATVIADSHAFVGYVLSPGAWGQGFATEMVTTNDKTEYTGFITRETADVIDLRDLTGKVTVVRKDTIAKGFMIVGLHFVFNHAAIDKLLRTRSETPANY